MHDIRDLEERWFNYKAKKILLPAVKVSALYAVMAGSYYMYSTKKDMLTSLLPSNRATTVLGVSMESNNSIAQKETTSEKLKTEEENSMEKIALAPIIPIVDMEKEKHISDDKKVRIVKRVKRVKSVKVSNRVKAKRNDYLTAKELAVMNKNHTQKRVSVPPKPRKTKKIHFTSTSANYVEMMKDKFAKSKTPRDALLLAKNYYKESNYEEAEKWSLSANKLDNSLEESWLLFAKSKAKQGKKKEALKILVSYYKKSQSPKAKALIGQIQTGRI